MASTLSSPEKIDYSGIIARHPWIIERNRKCIISPDTDGILCGLFMSAMYNWEVVGYYDGKELALKRDIQPPDCVFLDMEIYRNNCKSIGQHMLLYNKNSMPGNWSNFDNSINPNNIRGYDANKNFAHKYPLATIHLLMCIAKTTVDFSILKSAITCLLYVDGTFKNLLNYPENCISWLKYLDAKDEKSPVAPLLNIFATQRISAMMHDLESIFAVFKSIADGKKGGDKIQISEMLEGSFSDNLLRRTHILIGYLGDLTGWGFNEQKWAVNNLSIIKFEKGIIPIGKLNAANYAGVLEQHPISFAITGTKQLEFTNRDVHGAL